MLRCLALTLLLWSAVLPAFGQTKFGQYSFELGGGFTAPYVATVKISAQRPDAFAGGLNPDLEKTLIAARERVVRNSKRDPSLFKELSITGYFGGKEIYWAEANFERSLRLTPLFDALASQKRLDSLTATVESLHVIRAMLDGYLAVNARNRWVDDNEAFEKAAEKRAQEIAPIAIKNFVARAGQKELSARGIEELNSEGKDLLRAMHWNSRWIGDPKRTAREEAVRKAQKDALSALIVSGVNSAKKNLTSFDPPRWDEILLIDEKNSELGAILEESNRGELKRELVLAATARGNELLTRPKFLQQFSEELGEFSISRESLEELADVAEVLEAKSAQFEKLKPYVEKAQSRMGEILVAHTDATIEAIGKAGSTIDDIPALLAESEDEAEWLSKWDASDLAAVIQLAAIGRTNDIAEANFEAFSAGLRPLPRQEAVMSPGIETLSESEKARLPRNWAQQKKRELEQQVMQARQEAEAERLISGPISRDDPIGSLREKLEFMKEYRGEVPALGRYVAALQERLEEIQYDLDSDVYKKLGIKGPLRGANVSVIGHVVSLGSFAKNIEAHGHKITKAKTKPGYASESGKILGALGWGTPEESLAAFTVMTKEGVEIELSMSEEHSGATFFSPNVIRKGKQEEELYPDEWVALALGLGAVVPTGYADDRGITDSDRFASDPADKHKVVETGIFADDLNLEVAIAASVAAIEANPDEPRYKFHLGRALFAAGEIEEAIRYLSSASDDGYAAADALLGPVFLEKATTGKRFSMSSLRAAKKHFKQALEGGYAEAKAGLDNTEKILAMMSPPFGQDEFDMRGWIKAVYREEYDSFARYNKNDHEYVRMYLLTVCNFMAEQDPDYKEEKSFGELGDYLPEYLKKIARSGSMATGELPSDFTREDLNELFANFGRATIFGNFQHMGGTTASAEDSAFILMMYLQEDRSEAIRFFENTLVYLKKHHSRSEPRLK